MKTVAYYRRSTNIQEHSLAMQEHKAYNKAIQEGLIIDEEYKDDAISGKSRIDDRRALKHLIEEIEQNKIKNLLVYKRDRLTRDAIQYIKLYRLFRDKNVNVIFTSDDEPPIQNSPVGELIEILLAAMVEREGQQIVERIKASIESDFLAGKNPGTLPFGYSVDRDNGNTIRQNEDEVELIRAMYRLAIEGKTIREISTYAREKWPQRKWTGTSVRKLLQNPTYVGIRFLNIRGLPQLKQEYSQLAIIEDDDWHKVQELLEQSPTKKRAPLPQAEFLLNNLLYCKPCKQLLVGLGRRRGQAISHFYKCSSCNQRIEKKAVEDFVIESSLIYVKSLFLTHYPKLLERYRFRNYTTFKIRLTQLERQLSKVTRQLNYNTQDYLFGEMEPKERMAVEDKLLTIYDKIVDLKKSKEKVEAEIASLNELPEKSKEL
ncbi:recombinase family protein [Heliorestis acidaminivorans]|uniref:recombinase family protein n=1 Tax=Heliorestis acidaminivorans TaxID=553427 RepID=UPI0014786DCD|nr:recombinase family protein [Heliorestis acidaminivorans]